MGNLLRQTYVPELHWIGDLRSAWPDAPREPLSLKDRADQRRIGTEEPVRVRPLPLEPAAVDRAELLLDAVLRLPSPERMILVGWAVRVKMSTLAQYAHTSRRSAWRYLDRGCRKIAAQNVVASVAQVC